MPRSPRKPLRFAAIILGLALMGGLMWGIYSSWSTGKRLAARIDALRQAGDPVTIADLAPAPVAPEADAEVPFQDVEGEVLALQKDLTAIFPKVGKASGSLTYAQRGKLEAAFQAHPAVIPALLEAASRPEYAPSLLASLTPGQFLNVTMARTTAHRAASRAMSSWSTLLVAQGRRDEAVAVATAALRLARTWSDDPTLMAYQLSIALARTAGSDAVDAIQAGPISEVSRRALDAELARHDHLEALRRAYKNERAYSLSSVREQLAGAFWVRGWVLDSLILLFLDLYDEQLRRTHLSYAEARAIKAPATPGRLHPLKTLVVLLESSMGSLRDTAERQRAFVRSLRVFNALQALPADAASPSDLTALGLPREAILDPFTDRALIVKKRPDGWLVYSVGRDLVDDGGVLDKDQDVGVGPKIAGPLEAAGANDSTPTSPVGGPATAGEPNPGSSPRPDSP